MSLLASAIAATSLSGLVPIADGVSVSGQHWHHEEAGQRECQSDAAKQNASQRLEPALEKLQDGAEGGGEQRPLHDAPTALPGGL